MAFPSASVSDWRALVEKELAGKPFDKALVEHVDGLALLPLYTQADVEATAARVPADAPFKICVRATSETAAEELAEGADAVWMPWDPAVTAFGVFDPPAAPVATEGRSVIGHDPLAEGFGPERVSGCPNAVANAVASTLPFHDAGAEVADEVAIALAIGVHALPVTERIAFRLAVGRDTFVELCKLRALRVCWEKILVASGKTPKRALVHAVCANRTLAARDPWVNMLRVTTQVFAAVLGGADLVTPNEFDRALGTPSALGRRVARSTGLVLREESFLGRITDPGGGSYYFETLTDALAREAWQRFRAIQADGGIVSARARVLERIEASWTNRLARLATRKIPVLGVSEFANLDEKLPVAATARDDRRDAAPFEALRLRAEARNLQVQLVPLGSFAETRARVGFATNFFAAGGIRAREDAAAPIACLCGPDERYAAEAAGAAKRLKEAGASRVLLAGRPGPYDGVDGFLHLGCDALGILGELVDGGAA